MKRLCLSLVFFISVFANAKETPKFPVSAIAEDLKKDVNFVYREDQATFSILSRSTATYKVHQVITILNANAKGKASHAVYYDKLTKISYIKATVYDADGAVTARLKNSEIIDQSIFSNMTLYSDNRVKHFDLSQGTYPYTVEVEYEVEYKYLFQIPTWSIEAGAKGSVENSVFTLQYAPGLAPRYKGFNLKTPPVVEKKPDGSGSITFKASHLLPLKSEPFSHRKNQIVVSAPTAFEFSSYVGVMDTWDNFGKWIQTLNNGRDVLPEATRKKIHALTANAKTTEEKVKILYEYLQGKTRYVGIQLGIGGYQPFEAAVVDETGYGDCKALSNYMVAMLKEIGIKGYYTLITADDLDITDMAFDMPTANFNHAIACVPNGKDTLWLECTSQVNPFGYQGTFTGDRKALMITEGGAKVVNTTRYTAEQNRQTRVADVTLDATGNAKAKVSTSYHGVEYENGNLNFILDDPYEDQKKWLEDNIEIPNFTLNSFSLQNHKDKLPEANVNIDLTLPRLASVSGKRVFLTPNLMNRVTDAPDKVEARTANVVLTLTYTHLDTIRYHLPEGIYPEFLPKPIVVKSRFGEYEASFTMESNQLVYTRKLKRLKGEFPPETYTELIDFYKGIIKADNVKVVFLSKT